MGTTSAVVQGMTRGPSRNTADLEAGLGACSWCIETFAPTDLAPFSGEAALDAGPVGGCSSFLLDPGDKMLSVFTGDRDIAAGLTTISLPSMLVVLACDPFGMTVLLTLLVSRPLIIEDDDLPDIESSRSSTFAPSN